MTDSTASLFDAEISALINLTNQHLRRTGLEPRAYDVPRFVSDWAVREAGGGFSLLARPGSNDFAIVIEDYARGFRLVRYNGGSTLTVVLERCDSDGSYSPTGISETVEADVDNTDHLFDELETSIIRAAGLSPSDVYAVLG